jgi:hypothetical protein
MKRRDGLLSDLGERQAIPEFDLVFITNEDIKDSIAWGSLISPSASTAHLLVSASIEPSKSKTGANAGRPICPKLQAHIACRLACSKIASGNLQKLMINEMPTIVWLIPKPLIRNHCAW